MYCQQCGAEMRPDAKFCSKCGGTIVEPSAPSQMTGILTNTTETTTLPMKKVSWKMWSLVIVLLVVLGAGGVLCWHMFTQPKLGDTRINPIDKAEMVWVPGGTFTMGSSDGVGSENEHPAHQVKLSGYWIYKYEVTVAQYRAFCAATTHALPSFPSGYSWAGKTGWDDPALQQHPIVNVSWNDAKAYADWAKAALPSEAQWEYAARGPEERNYSWGGTATAADPYNGWDQTKCANSDNSYRQNISTWSVGSFPAGASWCGAQDLAGNVWEWCADWGGNYNSMLVTDPTGPASGTVRVLRGGAWGNGDLIDGLNGRGAYRDSNCYPGYWYGYLGFRCASVSPGR